MKLSSYRAAPLAAGVAFAALLTLGGSGTFSLAAAQSVYTTPRTAEQVTYGGINVDGLNIAYREAGDPSKPKLVLLHGFPASSHQYRDLIPALADRFHVIAPDYQGFGNSDAPDPAKYAYTFDGIALTMEKFLAAKGFDHYGLFVQDYGGPVGFRIAGRHPEALDWLIVQNSNAYEEGFTKAWDGLRGALWKTRTPETEKPLAGFLTHDAIKSFYLHGAANPEVVSPDNWESDYGFMQRPHSVRMNLDLFYDYRNNVALYPQWHDYFKSHQPPTLIVWGRNDPFFTVEGARAYARDNPNVELHLLETGHFVLEDRLGEATQLIRAFLAAHLDK